MGTREDDAISLVRDAFAAAGVSAVHADADAGGGAADLVLDLGGVRAPVQVKRWAVLPEHAVRSSPVFHHHADPSTLRVVVADRISQDARRALQDAGWGWLDLRGTLHVQGPGLLIHTEVPPLWERPGPLNPLAAPAGLAVACALLTDPVDEHTVRGLARRLRRSPSTVSETLRALKAESLVKVTTNQPTTELFWRVAEVWPSRRTSLAGVPGPGMRHVNEALHLGVDDIESTAGWALTDTLAAAAYGAPVAARADQPADYFVPTEALVRRARTLLGVAPGAGEARATVRVAPVPEACGRRVDASRWSAEARPLAAPLFVALDLAQDAGRGREILDGWTPPNGWARVW
ncbi:transcriptional regulator [Cellulomonas iranensis]|uniref:transcriptional regulator n=1 Tax=Cellulomonas iranensis TaxID=76862 RepID=UPI001C4E9955|nr:transcriptional regulator [Cellulomonas iranensis]